MSCKESAGTMQRFQLVLIMFGLVVLQSTWSQVHTGRCSYAGVVHLEGSSRYSLNYKQALERCQSLGYSLATEEQLTKAYNLGLKTCRHGWIEGQKTSFLPHNDDPKCTFNSTGIISHAENQDSLYDVYCFTQSDSVEISCEDPAVSTSTPEGSQPTDSVLTTIGKPEEEDVLEEVIADGFIVDVKEPTSSMTNKRAEDTNMTATVPNSLNRGETSTQSPQVDHITAITVAKDPRVTTEESETDSVFITEEVKYAIAETTIIPDQDTTVFPEYSEGAYADILLSEVTENYYLISDYSDMLTTEETITNIHEDGSGMSPETFNEKSLKDLITPTSVIITPRDLHSTSRLLEFFEPLEGSGMVPDVTTSITPTSKGTPKSVEVEIDEALIQDITNPHLMAEGPVQNKGRMNLPIDPEPTTSARADERTPAWLIIFAFCMTLGAILCIFAGIATKDMWYGPSKRMVNTTTTEPDQENGNAATLPLSVKEQELMTLMNGSQQKDDFTVISLEESPEKEYLM